MHVLEWPFIVTSPSHTYAIIMLFDQHLDMPRLSRWVEYLGKWDMLTNTHFNTFEFSVHEKVWNLLLYMMWQYFKDLLHNMQIVRAQLLCWYWLIANNSFSLQLIFYIQYFISWFYSTVDDCGYIDQLSKQGRAAAPTFTGLLSVHCLVCPLKRYRRGNRTCLAALS